MPFTQTLRTLEQVFGLLSWGAFGLCAAGVLGLSALALTSEPAPAPEVFLLRLGVVLAATLVPTLLFRLAAHACRRMRAWRGPSPPTVLGGFSPFEDSTIR